MTIEEFIKEKSPKNYDNSRLTYTESEGPWLWHPVDLCEYQQRFITMHFDGKPLHSRSFNAYKNFCDDDPRPFEIDVYDAWLASLEEEN